MKEKNASKYDKENRNENDIISIREKEEGRVN